MNRTYELTVNGQPHAVRETRAAAMACLLMEGPVEIAVTVPFELREAVIRPLKHGLKFIIEGRTLRFTLPRPLYLSLEFNGDLTWPLLLLADAPGEMPVAEHVRSFGPGGHAAGMIDVPDGGVIYFAPGAVVNGHIHLQGQRGVRILGPGILNADDGGTQTSPTPILLEDCTDILVDGPLVSSYREWNCIVRACRQVTIRNFKAVSAGVCSDGIDVDGSSQVRVQRCFLKTNDDCLVIKSTPPANGARVEDVEFSDCVLWNGPAGNGVDIGYETQTDFIRNIVFRDVDLIHVECHRESGWIDRIAGLAMHVTGDAIVDGVRFENVTLEDVQTPKLIQFMVFHYYRDHGWFSPPDRRSCGKIRNVHLKNVSFLRVAAPRVHVEGWNGPRDIENITFEDVFIEGKKAQDCPDLIAEIINTENFQWR